MKRYYIGLMSGTSADAIDAVLVDFSTSTAIQETHSHPYSTTISQSIRALARPAANEIERALELDITLGKLFAAATLALLSKAGISSQNIIAIGSHGQTIRHRPATSDQAGFSWQIADPNTIAEITGITTIADFRRRDIAAGGQGAPLVPAFHQSVFQCAQQNRMIVNIGGIANVTWLPTTGAVVGFDTGPGNTLMDAWVQQHRHQAYDAEGRWAEGGNVDELLLSNLLKDRFFTLPFPKSTGPEYFNLPWLAQHLGEASASPQNIQATLLALTARSIAQTTLALAPKENTDVFVCGGGAKNTALMHCLQKQLPDFSVCSTATLGVDPLWVEALAFAWLAKQTIEGKAGNLAGVTGAQGGRILGGVYPG